MIASGEAPVRSAGRTGFSDIVLTGLQGCEEVALNLVFEAVDRFNIRAIRCPIALPCDMVLLP
jgi:hypothetical protein